MWCACPHATLPVWWGGSAGGANEQELGRNATKRNATRTNPKLDFDSTHERRQPSKSTFFPTYLDVILVSGGVDNGVVVLGSVELLGVTLDGDTTFTFFLACIKVVGETEGRFALFVGHGLELFHLTSRDATHLEDEVTASGGFSGIDVTADDEGEVDLVRHLGKS